MHAYWSVTFALLMACGTRAELLTDLRRDNLPENGMRRASSPTWMYRDRRTSRILSVPHRIVDLVSDPSDCFLVYADEGELFYKAASDEGLVCGIYFIAPQDKKIELAFTYLDVPCDDGGVVAWVDGWELNGQVWPASDARGEERVVEVCGRRRPRQLLLSQQNAALLQYRVPARARGFSVRVRHVRNARPCNVMLYGGSGVHTLHNYGAARNCSLVSVGPAVVHVLALDVGVTSPHPNNIEVETGAMHQCIKRGIVDHAEIGGSSTLDHTNMEILDSLCGLDSNEEHQPALIGCANTVVRLVSSGRYRNSITVSFQPLDDEDLSRADLLCEI